MGVTHVWIPVNGILTWGEYYYIVAEKCVC